MEKVRKHPLYKDYEPPDQQSIAEDLVDPVKVKERFDQLLDIEQYAQNIRDGDECELTHTLEHDKLREQQKMDVASVCYLPVKLLLSKLQRPVPLAALPFTTLLRLKFGPLHAGLIVGDISIEWNDSSLVDPQPEPDIPGDLQVHVESMGLFREHAKEMVQAMSLANRRNMGTPVKLKIVYRSRDEKEKLLGRLTDVIVEYNRSKRYSLFSCNCQDFVKDALRALQIQEVANFGGNLGDYFQGLKRGKVAGLQFDSHVLLDAYVTENTEILDKHEKEYLLCLYFQFHSTELGCLTPDEQENWKCSIQSCMCRELEYNIEQESTFFHRKFNRPRPTHTSSPVSHWPKILGALEEERDDEAEVNEEARNGVVEGGIDNVDHAAPNSGCKDTNSPPPSPFAAPTMSPASPLEQVSVDYY